VSGALPGRATPRQGEHNRKTPVKSTLLAEKVTGECGIKKNGCMPQYRLAIAHHQFPSREKVCYFFAIRNRRHLNKRTARSSDPHSPFE
tara:strand:- start:2851 stop:3117 length:267 start_codon:yes stop_codon:yes gene_type:complete